MKKIILCILLVFILPICMLFTGCGTPKAKEYEQVSNDRFVIIKEYRSGEEFYIILVDKETKVLYLRFTSYYRAGITVMVDSDGNPLLYEGEIEE